jgi:carbamoyl-phosphate synthase large subunit
MKNILITSAGRRVSLVQFFQVELKKIIPDAKVYTTDTCPEYASACIVSDGFFKVGKVNGPSYIDDLLKISIQNRVRLIIPTIDTELLVLSKNIDLFQRNGITIVISNYDIVSILRDKRLTHRFFEDNDINYAKEYSKDNYNLPIFIKPYDGSRSVDNFIIQNKEQFTDYHFQNEKLLFLEYLDHKTHVEFTVDLYYDKNSDLKCIIPRQRIEVRDGEVNKAITKETFFMNEIFEKMKFIKGFRGCITFQIFVNLVTNKV